MNGPLFYVDFDFWRFVAAVAVIGAVCVAWGLVGWSMRRVD